MKILVPFDISAASRAAFSHALSLTAHSEGDLLNVVPTADAGEDAPNLAREAGIKLRAFRRDSHAPDGRCKVSVRVGIPFHEIGQIAENKQCDLIVLGRHDPDGEQAEDGYISDRVLRYAKSPVLLVRAPTALNRTDESASPAQRRLRGFP